MTAMRRNMRTCRGANTRYVGPDFLRTRIWGSVCTPEVPDGKGTEAGFLPRGGETASAGGGSLDAALKAEVVLRLLRGEEIDFVSREVGVNAARLAEWREEFISGGREALKSREATSQDRELVETRAKVGELMMRNDILELVLRKRGVQVP